MKNKLPIVAAVILFVFLLTGCGKGSIYKEASDLYNSGDYQNAALKFAEAGDYKDSADMILESNYMYATTLLSSGDYKSALSIFEELGSYKDSADMILETKYQQGINDLENHNYYSADKLFKELGEYKDSSAKLKEVADSKIYENALKAIDEGRYSRALDEFKKIKDFKDVDTYISRFTTYTKVSTMNATQKDNFGNRVGNYTESYEYNDAGDIKFRSTKNSFHLNETSSHIHAWTCNPFGQGFASTEEYRYDDNHRLIEIEGFESGRYLESIGEFSGLTNYIASFEYNDKGQIIKENFTTTNDTGYMDLTYDDLGQLIRVQCDPSHGFAIVYTYDYNGNIASVYNSLGYSESYYYVYDEDNKIIEETVNLSYGQSYHDAISYDEDGNITEIQRTFPNSNGLDTNIRFNYKEYVFYN